MKITEGTPEVAVPGDAAAGGRGALGTAALTAGVLVCFAANSLLCRAALGRALVDPASFTAIRLGSGAVALWLLVASTRRGARARLAPGGGSWVSALVLVAYAVTFSLAYVRIPASVGALVLFAAVQATMIGWAITRGTHLSPTRWFGVALATGGLAWLTLPGVGAPDLSGTALMAASGVGWGVYSLRGARATDPVGTTADNFLRSAPLALGFLAAQGLMGGLHGAPRGVMLAVLSGTVASGGGYVLWYAVLPALGAPRAATLQLAVPVIAALGAVIFLGEPVTGRLASAGLAILAGVALAVGRRTGTGGASSARGAPARPVSST